MSSIINSITITIDLPAEALAATEVVLVDDEDIEGSTWGGVYGEQCAERIAAAGVADLTDWEAVGYYYRNLSGWCEFEGKMEYHHETKTALVRKTDLAAARSAWFAANSAPLTHNPFAVLAK